MDFNISLPTLTDIAHENRSGLLSCWELARTCIEAAADRYGISKTYAEKIAKLSIRDIEKAIQVKTSLFGLRYPESEIFRVQSSLGAHIDSSEMQAVIIKENRAGLIIRWNATRCSIEDSMELFSLSRKFAEKLSSLPYEFIDRAADVTYPLIKLTCPEAVIDLLPNSLTHDELSMYMVLHG